MGNNPTYKELEEKLQQATQILDALQSHKADAVIGTDQIAMMRLKEVEDQLRKQIQISSNRLKEIESIYKNVPVGLCILNTDLEFIRINNHLAEMNGIPADEHIGKTISELLPNLNNDIEAKLEKVIKKGESQMNVEISGETPAQPGLKRYWLHHWLPLYSKMDNKLLGINMVIQEITDRKKYEQKLKKLNESLEERVQARTESLLSYQSQLRSLASQLSKAEEQERQQLATELHDNLGQMLAMGKMKADLLHNEDLPEETISKIDEIRDLMDDALSYSRKLISDLKPPPTLKEDLLSSMEWLQNKMEDHGLKVILHDDGNSKPTTEEIRTTLLQAVRELLFNVLKHTEVKEARLKLLRHKDQVKIVVEDKGEGFNPDEIAVSEDEGGFGLFNVRERLDLLGCSFNISSEKDEGTTITILAPLKNGGKEEEETEQIPEQSLSSKGGHKIKVLLADDHKLVRQGLKKIINAENDMTVVAEAADGEEAIKETRKVVPDIILMDVNMPVKNGIEATQEIMKEMSQVRVVGLSLHDDEKVTKSMREAGASAYLTKNEAFKTLCATIRSEASVTLKN